MITRVVFLCMALALVCAGIWAYHHDQKLRENVFQVTIGDPNEIVRQMLGDPTREGSCGSLTAVPTGCGPRLGLSGGSSRRPFHKLWRAAGRCRTSRLRRPRRGRRSPEGSGAVIRPGGILTANKTKRPSSAFRLRVWTSVSKAHKAIEEQV